MGEHHAEFGLFKDHVSSSSSFAYCGCDLVVSNEFVELIDVCLNDPYELNYEFIEGYGSDYAKVDLIDN